MFGPDITFLGVDRCDLDDPASFAGADVVIVGAPFDGGTSYRSGARFGPQAMRSACYLAHDGSRPSLAMRVDGLQDMRVVDAGDVELYSGDAVRSCADLEVVIEKIASSGAIPLVLGGDHTITWPDVTGVARARGWGKVSVIHFDAHSDLWQDDDMSRIDHGTFFYKAVKTGLIDPKTSVQIGIRTACDDYLGVEYIDARTVHERGCAYAVARAKEIVGNRPTYVTFDIDCLDPSAAPGTGTPVWGGLHSWQAAACLRDLAGINMVGGDVVEVSPPFDPSGVTAHAGVTMMFEILCPMAEDVAKCRK